MNAETEVDRQGGECGGNPQLSCSRMVSKPAVSLSQRSRITGN